MATMGYPTELTLAMGIGQRLRAAQRTELYALKSDSHTVVPFKGCLRIVHITRLDFRHDATSNEDKGVQTLERR